MRVRKLSSDSFIFSILLTFVVYYLFQSALTFLLFSLAETPHLLARFHIFSALFHLAALILFVTLYKGLLSRKRCAPLSKINVPLRITFVRVSTLPTILFTFVLAAEDERFVLPLLVLMVIASLSDALDGFFSRKLDQATVIGAYFDSISDYAYLTAITLMCLFQGYVRALLGYAILVRLAFQLTAVLIIYALHKRATSGTTIIGKITIGFLILFFNIIILGFFPALSEFRELITPTFEWIGFACIVLSTLERIVLFTKDISREPHERVQKTQPQKKS